MNGPDPKPKNMAVITIMFEPKGDAEVMKVKAAITEATNDLEEVQVELRTTERRKRE